MKTWLVLDCNHLCWRSFYTTGKLAYGDRATGVTFGFFKAIQVLMDEHQTTDVIFCFDHGKSKRKELYPAYKGLRDKDPEQAKVRLEVQKQIETIKTKYLPSLGFKNVFYQEGYEADDLIAAFVDKHWKVPGTDFIVVSSDKDLYQILHPGVTMYDPIRKEAVNGVSFRAKYNIPHTDWPKVKALAGCKSDYIRGIPRFGEKTAIKFLTSNTILTDDQQAVYKANLQLVTLPLKGCKAPAPKKDEVNPEAWKKLCRKLGFATLADRTPGVRVGFGLKPGRLGGYPRIAK
jgi:DNA polymerase I